uniref:Uncharacterized protein n=1 Tax=Knipowitschia caucasica TaxID=637954 RepID=A0AAV2JWW1_KNICA
MFSRAAPCRRSALSPQRPVAAAPCRRSALSPQRPVLSPQRPVAAAPCRRSALSPQRPVAAGNSIFTIHRKTIKDSSEAVRFLPLVAYIQASDRSEAAAAFCHRTRILLRVGNEHFHFHFEYLG